MITISKKENTHKNTYSIHLWISIWWSSLLGSITSFLHYLFHFIEYLVELYIYKWRDDIQSFRNDIIKVNIKWPENIILSHRYHIVKKDLFQIHEFVQLFSISGIHGTIGAGVRQCRSTISLARGQIEYQKASIQNVDRESCNFYRWLRTQPQPSLFARRISVNGRFINPNSHDICTYVEAILFSRYFIATIKAY